jgi:hypothetical protein
MTPEIVLNALRLAFDQGWINLQLTDFAGWNDTCDCKKCTSQRIVYGFLWKLQQGHFENTAGTAYEVRK